MHDINCIFCDIPNSRAAIEENGFTGKQCSSCSLIYISPRPHLNSIVTIYSHDDAHIAASAHISGSLLKRLYARHTLNIIKKYKNNGDLLEIGSGGGYFLDEAKKIGFNPHGIELNPVQATFIQDTLHIPCEEQLLSGDSFGTQQFDVIYHSDVISHFYDPIAEFRTMYNKLKEKGVLVFETGNIGDIKEKYYKEFTRFQYPDHLFFFSEQNLEHLLTMTGFKLIKIYRYNILPQLKLMKLLQRNRLSQQPGESQTTSAHKKESWKMNVIKKIYYMMSYIIRYKLGAILPKNKRPQTIIIVAHKI